MFQARRNQPRWSTCSDGPHAPERQYWVLTRRVHTMLQPRKPATLSTHPIFGVPFAHKQICLHCEKCTCAPRDNMSRISGQNHAMNHNARHFHAGRNNFGAVGHASRSLETSSLAATLGNVPLRWTRRIRRARLPSRGQLVLARRPPILERTSVREAREAVAAEGRVVPQPWLGRTTAPGVATDDWVGRGEALCCDVTLVSLLRADGRPQPASSDRDGMGPPSTSRGCAKKRC